MRGWAWVVGMGLAMACGGAGGRVDADVDVRADRIEATADLPDGAPDAVDAAEPGEPARDAPEPAAEAVEASPEPLEAPAESVDAPPEVPDAVEELDLPPVDAPDAAEPGDVSGDAEVVGEVSDACSAEGACPACSTDAACDDGLPCTRDACVDGECRHEPWGTCCEGEGGCDDGNPCTADACVDGRCATTFVDDPACCAEATLPDAAWSFELGLPPGATLDVPAGAHVTWTTRADQATDGTRSLWFGDPASGTYRNPSGPAGQPEVAEGTVLLPAVLLPPGGTVYAAFDLRLDTEWNAYAPGSWELPGPELAYDELTLLVNGVAVWSSFVYEIAGSTCHYGTCSWKPVEVSLADFAGQSVALGFRFDSGSPVANDHAGPFLDRLRLEWACAPLDCFSSMECDDGKDPLDVCTRDKCLGRQCVFEPTYYGGVACCQPVDRTTVTFDAGADALTLEASGSIGWQATSIPAGGRAHGGPGSLYLGDPLTHTWADPAGGAVAATARWAIEVPPFEGYELEWWQWLDLEDAADPARDAFTVSVRAVDASDAGQVVFSNKPLYGYPATWRHVVTSLDAWQNTAVEVVFAFDSVDGQANGGEGIYLDDLSFYYGCH